MALEILILQYVYKLNINKFNLNGQLSLNNLQINQLVSSQQLCQAKYRG